jgi:uncharacterized protein YbjT (DUF2867 family)
MREQNKKETRRDTTSVSKRKIFIQKEKRKRRNHPVNNLFFHHKRSFLTMAILIRLANLGIILIATTVGTSAFTTSPVFLKTITHRGTQKAQTQKLFRRQPHNNILRNNSPASSNNNDMNNCNGDNDPVESTSSRRDFLDASMASSLAAVLAATNVWSSSASSANAASAGAGAPICVIGANGKTGTRCVQACLDRSIPVIATSRTGVFLNSASAESPVVVMTDSPLFSQAVCDVTQPSTIAAAISNSRAVIFAASASKQGGTAAAVDNEGLVNVAAACIAAQVPHLVIVSSGGVSKPDSPVYKFLNIFGGIMEQKIRGEDAVRALYSEINNNNENSNKDVLLTYTIVRPGGLTEEPPAGVTSLELNQGDVVSGRISRADVAALCIESVRYPALTGGTTYECYAANTGKPLQSVGMSNIFKQTNSDNDSSSAVVKTGKERRGDTWEKLFTGLETDASIN